MSKPIGDAIKAGAVQTIIAAIVGLALWYTVVEVRQARIEERVANLERRNENANKELADRLGKIEQRVDQIFILLTKVSP